MMVVTGLMTQLSMVPLVTLSITCISTTITVNSLLFGIDLVTLTEDQMIHCLSKMQRQKKKRRFGKEQTRKWKKLEGEVEGKVDDREYVEQ